eukprot:scaffold2349_cov407-Prasinococcus_capsulatus_cf.AAC.4
MASSGVHIDCCGAHPMPLVYSGSARKDSQRAPFAVLLLVPWAPNRERGLAATPAAQSAISACNASSSASSSAVLGCAAEHDRQTVSILCVWYYGRDPCSSFLKADVRG